MARALADGAPVSRPRARAWPSRLTMTWTLVTGVPLLGIAAIAIADLAGVAAGRRATAVVATLFLAVAGLVVGVAVDA